MMTHLPISHQITFLPTRDLEATARFYEGVLGLDIKLDQGGCRVYHVAGHGHIGFCQRDEAGTGSTPDASGGVILTFVTDDVDAWYEHLVAQDVIPEEKPTVNARFRIYHFFVRDPDDHIVEFQRFLHEF